MKLVIDIPEDVIEHAKNKSEDSNDEYVAMRAIASGTPIGMGDKFEDASCENCEHATRLLQDQLNIFQDSNYLFYCAAGHAYGGSETVCSEWRRKEGDRNDGC